MIISSVFSLRIYYGYNIYSFPKWEQIIKNAENVTNNYYDSPCLNIKNKIPEDKINLLSDSLCKTTMVYFKEIRSVNDYKKEEDGCKYMYYWIYKKTEKETKKRIMLTKQIYNYLLQKYNEYIEEVCKYYKDINITDDEMEKVDDINDMHKYLISIKNDDESSDKKCSCAIKFILLDSKHKTYCESNYNHDFCKALMFLKNEFNEKIKTINCDNSDYGMIFSYQKDNSKRPIIISIVAVLLAFFLLINVYKFTPFGAYLSLTLKNRINTWNNESEERNRFQLSEISTNASTNNIYNILYKST
ncbi:variable surface protein [Plasmodium gonderi]|uniref:Variable surface protein n=1 Tax=Plasmodium gonderi TaxID=77519 RepID=A0A1Y1JKB3_PLAGO|nr:variable surface protein [Plasmodium gonderi]GAW82730.1 variable surface protein [Plasmodium gonderi]